MKRTPFRTRPKVVKPRLKLEVPKATGVRLDGGKKPWRSREYRKYVPENFGCLVCYTAAAHAHHIRECFPRTMGVRISDIYVVPLCESCHTELHARSASFWRNWGITPGDLLEWCESVHAAWSKT